MPRGNATVDPTITTSEKAIFQSDRHVRNVGLDSGGLITAPGDGAPARGIRFRVPTASAATLRVRIPGLHRAGEYAFLKAEENGEYVLESGGKGNLDVAYISTASGTATFNYEVFG